MDKIKGIAFVIFAAIVFGFIPFFAKTAFANGFNEMTFILGKCTLATIFIYIYTRVKGIDLKLNKTDTLNVIKVSIIGYAVMFYALISSYKYMPTGIATSIHFVYPLVVMIGGVIFYKEKITPSKIAVIATALVGIFLIAGLKDTKDLSFLGFLLAFGSGILYAYYILVIGSGSLRKVNSLKLAFYIYFLNIFFFFFASLFTGNFKTDITFTGFYYIALLSILSMFGMISFKKGLEIINTVTGSILSTFEPLTSLFVGALFLKEVLLIHHIVGSLLILTAVIFAALIEKKERDAVNIGAKEKVK